MNQDMTNKILENMRTANIFSKNVTQCLIDDNKPEFEIVYQNYKSNRIEKTTDKEKSVEDIEIDIRRSICSALLKFMHTPEFNENKVFDYLNTLNNEITPQILSFLLWSQEKKESALSLLKEYPSDFTSEQYDFLYEIVQTHNHLNGTSLFGQKKIDYLKQQKNEFFFYQSRCHLKAELDNLPINETKSKRIKL